MHEYLYYAEDRYDVQAIDSGTFCYGEDDKGKWKFTVLFGDRFEATTFAFGHLCWQSAPDAIVEALMIQVEHSDSKMEDQIFLSQTIDSRAEYSVEMPRIRNMFEFIAHSGELSKYWNKFFPRFAMKNYAELRPMIAYYPDQAFYDYLAEDDCSEEDWRGTYVWDDFILDLRGDLRDNELVFSNVSLRLPTELELELKQDESFHEKEAQEEAFMRVAESVCDDDPALLAEYKASAAKEKAKRLAQHQSVQFKKKSTAKQVVKQKTDRA